MRIWICPECGRECSLLESECPACSGRGERSPDIDPGQWSSIEQAYAILCEELLGAAPAEPDPEAGAAAKMRLAWNPAPPPEQHLLPGVLQPGDFPRERPKLPAWSAEPRRPEPRPRFTPPRPGAVRAREEPSSHWFVTFAVIALIVLAVASIAHRLANSEQASASSPVPDTFKALPVNRLQAPSHPREHPFARYVEVTGLRVVSDPDGKSEVEYLVVNHSGARLLDLGLRLDVRSAAGADGSEPLFRVSARIPTLGPHEAKELHTPLDRRITSQELPDWQNLRTSASVMSGE